MMFHKKTIAYSLGIAAIYIAVTTASATIYTGFLDSETGLTGTADWANAARLSWTITNEASDPALPSSFVWKYTYTMSVPNKGISHIIIEASNGESPFTSANIRNLSGVGGVLAEVNEYDPTDQSGSNPLMPSDMYGIKLEGWSGDYTNLCLTFYSDRQPVWGDFYSKDGVSNVKGTKIPVVVYNEGFTADDPTAPAADGSLQGHLLVPDTTPEPSLLTLLAAGSLGLLRRKRQK